MVKLFLKKCKPQMTLLFFVSISGYNLNEGFSRILTLGGCYLCWVSKTVLVQTDQKLLHHHHQKTRETILETSDSFFAQNKGTIFVCAYQSSGANFCHHCCLCLSFSGQNSKALHTLDDAWRHTPSTPCTQSLCQMLVSLKQYTAIRTAWTFLYFVWGI